MPPRVFTAEEREKLKTQMLEQAFPLLEKYGMKHMSVEKITKHVGIGKSTFYNFFDSKEDYVSKALEMNRQRILDNIDMMYADGRKMKPQELFQLYFNTLLNNNSIYRNFTAEDEKALYEVEKAHGKEVSLERETMIANRILSHVEGVREDLDAGLIANYIKLMVLAYENAYLFHESAMERMQMELKLRLIDLLFEDGTKKELIEILKNGTANNDHINDAGMAKVMKMQGAKEKK